MLPNLASTVGHLPSNRLLSTLLASLYPERHGVGDWVDAALNINKDALPEIFDFQQQSCGRRSARSESPEAVPHHIPILSTNFAPSCEWQRGEMSNVTQTRKCLWPDRLRRSSFNLVRWHDASSLAFFCCRLPPITVHWASLISLHRQHGNESSS